MRPEWKTSPDAIYERWTSIFEDDELDWTDDQDAWTAAEQLAAETGLELLGVGNSRAVFALDKRRVLKLAFWNGDEDNLYEINKWDRATRRTRRWLAPVRDWGAGGAWLIMARGAPLSPRLAKAVHDGRFDRVGSALGVDDLRAPSNWGLIGRRMVIIDYGAEPLDGWRT